MNYILVTSAIIGVVQFFKQYIPQINGGVTILVAAIIGGIAGLFQVEGLNVVTGIFVGLAGAGVHEVFNNTVSTTAVTQEGETGSGTSTTTTAPTQVQ